MNKYIIWIGSAVFSVYIGLFAYLARFTSPAGDDYMHYLFYINNTSSIIQTVIYHWFRLGSRFTSMFMISLGNSLGIMDNYYIHTLLAIALSLFSIYFIVTSLFNDIKASSKIFITVLLQSIWLAAAIDLKETLYWLAGVNYYWTCSILMIQFSLIVNINKGINVKVYTCLLGVLVFLNSGASELSAAYQIPMFVGAALITAASSNVKCSKCMLIMLLIAVAGLILQLLNPGNAVRITEDLSIFGPSLNPITKDFVITLKIGLNAGLISTYQFFTSPILYALLLFMPVISDNVKQPIFTDNMRFKFKIWHIFLFQIITACCFQAIGGYSTGNALYPRAMGTVRFIMIAQWILFFVFLYRNSKFIEWIRKIKVYRYKEIIVLICLLMSTNFSYLRADYSIASEYSRKVAERSEYIKKQKALNNLNIIVPEINMHPKLFVEAAIPTMRNPQIRDYTSYYGINSIRELDPLIIEFSTKGRKSENEELKRIFADADAGDEEAILTLRALRGNELARIRLMMLHAEQGQMEAQFLLARYLDPTNGLSSPYIQENFELAVDHYFKLADKGHKGAQDNLWALYSGGLRTTRDFDIIIWGLKLMLSPF